MIQKQCKIILADILLLFSSNLRYKLTSILKKLKRSNKKEMIIDKKRNAPTKFIICITHDIDYLEDYKNIMKIAKIERKYGIKSCWNFVTNDLYKIDNKVIKELKKEGHEIGLHGFKHDIAFGYRKDKRIEKELRLATKNLEKVKINGFRAPALSYSKNLFKILSKLNFKYDSSIPDYKAETIFPFKIKNTKLWELPLTTPQDSELFRDRNLDNKKAYNLLTDKLKQIKKVQGTAILLFHPCIIQKRLDLYEELIKFIKKQQAWICTPNELVDFLDKKENKKRNKLR